MNQRDAAWCLLIEFTQSESLRKHALAVEACMRAYARKAAADEELWGMVGLLHDFDYEKYPSADDHPYKGSEILKERGYSESFPWARRARRRCTGRATGWRGALPKGHPAKDRSLLFRRLRLLSGQSKNLQLLVSGNEDLTVRHDWNQVRIAAQIRPCAGTRLKQLRDCGSFLARVWIKCIQINALVWRTR